MTTDTRQQEIDLQARNDYILRQLKNCLKDETAESIASIQVRCDGNRTRWINVLPSTVRDIGDAMMAAKSEPIEPTDQALEPEIQDARTMVQREIDLIMASAIEKGGLVPSIEAIREAFDSWARKHTMRTIKVDVAVRLGLSCWTLYVGELSPIQAAVFSVVTDARANYGSLAQEYLSASFDDWRDGDQEDSFVDAVALALDLRSWFAS